MCVYVSAGMYVCEYACIYVVRVYTFVTTKKGKKAVAYTRKNILHTFLYVQAQVGNANTWLYMCIVCM